MPLVVLEGTIVRPMSGTFSPSKASSTTKNSARGCSETICCGLTNVTDHSWLVCRGHPDNHIIAGDSGDRSAQKTLGHGKLAANFGMDGMRAPERWWFET